MKGRGRHGGVTDSMLCVYVCVCMIDSTHMLDSMERRLSTSSSSSILQ